MGDLLTREQLDSKPSSMGPSHHQGKFTISPNLSIVGPISRFYSHKREGLAAFCWARLDNAIVYRRWQSDEWWGILDQLNGNKDRDQDRLENDKDYHMRKTPQLENNAHPTAALY